jgi:hypothetical protein
MKIISLKAALVAMMFVLGFTSCEPDEPKFTLIVEVTPENAGTATGGGEYVKGENVELTATANDGYCFVNWTMGTTILSTEATFEYVTTAEDVTISANFVLKNIAKLGAQENTSFGGFLSVSLKTIYTLAQAFANQDKIDIFCYYETYNNNFTTLAAPGSNITGIFTGDNAPANWTVKNQTFFTLPAVAITVDQFDALRDGDASIETYYNATLTSGNKKAKDMKVNDIWAFKTQAGTFGILKVLSVEQGNAGFVEFEYKLK